MKTVIIDFLREDVGSVRRAACVKAYIIEHNICDDEYNVFPHHIVQI